MTRDEAIQKVVEGVTGPKWYKLEAAGPMVDGLVALGLLKLEEPKEKTLNNMLLGLPLMVTSATGDAREMRLTESAVGAIAKTIYAAGFKIERIS